MLTRLNVAVFAPIARASESTVTAVCSGVRRIDRRAYTTSRAQVLDPARRGACPGTAPGTARRCRTRAAAAARASGARHARRHVHVDLPLEVIPELLVELLLDPPAAKHRSEAQASGLQRAHGRPCVRRG